MQIYFDEDRENAAYRTYDLFCLLHFEMDRSGELVKELAKIDWGTRKSEAVEHLRNAAKKLGEDDYFATNYDRYKNFLNLCGISINSPDYVKKLALVGLLPILLNVIADDIEKVSSQDVMPPIARTINARVDLSNVGTRGGASKPEGVERALLIKEINRRIPSKIGVKQDRYALISSLAVLGGVQVDRHYVRSLLKKGHT